MHVRRLLTRIDACCFPPGVLCFGCCRCLSQVHLSARTHREASVVAAQLTKATGELKEAIEQSKRCAASCCRICSGDANLLCNQLLVRAMRDVNHRRLARATYVFLPACREVFKQIAFTGAGWVKDSDVDSVTSLGAPCRDSAAAASATTAQNSSSSGSGSDGSISVEKQRQRQLRLNSTDPRLVAPLVVLAHSRVQYLAKTMLTLIRCDGTVM